MILIQLPPRSSSLCHQKTHTAKLLLFFKIFILNKKKEKVLSSYYPFLLLLRSFLKKITENVIKFNCLISVYFCVVLIICKMMCKLTRFPSQKKRLFTPTSKQVMKYPRHQDSSERQNEYWRKLYKAYFAINVVIQHIIKLLIVIDFQHP